MITEDDYFAGCALSRDITAEVKANAAEMLERVNRLRNLAAADGVELQRNPATWSGVSGAGSGGFRPQNSRVGATYSKHKTGHAVDSYDPHRQLASWCMGHLDVLEQIGLWLEDPRWTPTWVHLQDLPPGSGKTVYIPSTAPALAGEPPAWGTA
jgi:hypothetical protein